MYRILSASKDTYITIKIINNTYRATDANVGHAATLDLFKLYDESNLSGTTYPAELSRLLVHIDLDPLRALTSSILDYSHSSFKCTLKLHDVYGGQTTPRNFKVIAFPLSKSFDEGMGRDIVNFLDLDSANFLSARIFATAAGSRSVPANGALSPFSNAVACPSGGVCAKVVEDKNKILIKKKKYFNLEIGNLYR